MRTMLKNKLEKSGSGMFKGLIMTSIILLCVFDNKYYTSDVWVSKQVTGIL